MYNDQLQHDLIAVRAMIATLALGDMHNLSFGLLVAVVATIDMKARTVEMGKAGCQAQPLGGGRRDQTVECRHPVVIEGIQGTPQGVIRELFRGNAGRKKAIRGLIVEESGDQIQGVIDKPKPIESHGFDRLTYGEVPHFRVVFGRLIEDVTNAEFIEHASDKAEVVSDLTTGRGLIGHDNLL